MFLFLVGSTDEEATKHSLCRVEMGLDKAHWRNEVHGVFRVKNTGDKVAGNEAESKMALKRE